MITVIGNRYIEKYLVGEKRMPFIGAKMIPLPVVAAVHTLDELVSNRNAIVMPQINSLNLVLLRLAACPNVEK